MIEKNNNFLNLSTDSAIGTCSATPYVVKNTDIKRRESIMQRRHRLRSGQFSFGIGDIVNFSYVNQYINYGFEGLCISVRKRKRLDPDTAIVLRNILLNVGVEITVSFYYIRAYNFTLADHKRKAFNYRRAKSYYVRSDLNRASRI